jgi:hypothetical protein
MKFNNTHPFLMTNSFFEIEYVVPSNVEQSFIYFLQN